MRKLEIINSVSFSEWDAFVKNHPRGTIYHTSGWKKALEENFKQISGKIIAVRDHSTGNITAGMPIYIVKSHITGNRLVSIPFGTDGSPLTSNNEELSLIVNETIELFKSRRFSYIEIKSDVPINGILDLQFRESKQYITHYLLLNESLEKLFNKFHKKAVKVPLMKSKRNQLELKIGTCRKDLSNFYQIYYNLRKRLGLPIFYYGFFKSLWEIFKTENNISILLAIYKNKIIGSALLLKYNETVTVEYGADLIDYRKLYVNQFLDWESIKLSFSEGYKKFSFGRTFSNNIGLLTYKERWGTRSAYIPSYYYPLHKNDNNKNNENSKKYKLVNKILLSSPNFLYSKLSSFIYKHIG